MIVIIFKILATYLGRVGDECVDEHLHGGLVWDEKAVLHPLANLLSLFSSLQVRISISRQAAHWGSLQWYLLS